MAHKRAVTLFTVLALTSLSATSAKLDDGAARFPPGSVAIVAHRACWHTAPENSIAAMERCRALGVEAVEIDVMLTKDGRAVVFHDQTLDRMTDGSGQLSDFTWAELKGLRLKERDGVGSDLVDKRPFLTNHGIPLLADMLRAAGDDVLLNLDIKESARWTLAETFRVAVEVAQKTGTEHRVFWTIPAPRRGGATHAESAAAIFRQLPTDGLTMMTPIIWRSERSFLTQLEDYADEPVTMFELVTDDIDYWPRAEDGTIVGSDRNVYMGVSILPQWGGVLSDELAMRDPEAAWGGMIDLGFRLIMTDRPEQLADYLHERGLR